MMRQLIGGAAAIAGVSLALLVSTPTRRSKLLWLYNKGGFYFLLRATCGSRPRKNFLDTRGPDTWERLDRDEDAKGKEHAVMLTGSSILRRWLTAEQCLAPLPVLNRAFGGSRIWELDDVVADKIAAYAPAVLVHYCGSNDFVWAYHANVSFRKVAAEAAANTRRFAERLQRHLPGLQVLFVGAIRSPKKHTQGCAHAIDCLNMAVARMCSERPEHWHYADMNPRLECETTGEPRGDLYLDDGVHYKEESYKHFAVVLVPLIQKLAVRDEIKC